TVHYFIQAANESKIPIDTRADVLQSIGISRPLGNVGQRLGTIVKFAVAIGILKFLSHRQLTTSESCFSSALAHVCTACTKVSSSLDWLVGQVAAIRLMVAVANKITNSVGSLTSNSPCAHPDSFHR